MGRKSVMFFSTQALIGLQQNKKVILIMGKLRVII